MCRRVSQTLSILLLCATGLAGCVRGVPDDDDESTDGGMRRARAGGSDASGAGGAGRAAAPSGAGRGGVSGSASSVTCGARTCEWPPDGFAKACCADAATSTCGVVSLMGGRCTETVEDDMGCPVLDFGPLLMLPSCCTSRGMCGVDVTTVGGPGCLDLATAAERARMAGASAVFPSPRACSDDPGVSTDAGL
jgi:hypothetical protein